MKTKKVNKKKIFSNIILIILSLTFATYGIHYVGQWHNYDNFLDICGDGNYNSEFPGTPEEQWNKYTECNSEAGMIRLIAIHGYQNDMNISFATAAILLAFVIVYNKKTQ